MTDGKTSVYGLIGNPVSHSLSPFIHNELSKMTELNNTYVTFPVESDIESAIKGAFSMGIKGLNITIPYKKDVLPFLSEIDESALRIGAVNTLVRSDNGFIGYNTDITGVIRTLKTNNIRLENSSVVLLGAGGCANAAAFGALKMGAEKIFIVNRSNKNAQLLASRLKKYYNVNVEVSSFDDLPVIRDGYFIIQATSIGMNSGLSPINNEPFIKSSTGVFDVIYTPSKTRILEIAEKFDKPIINGLEMLVYQAVTAFELWNEISVGKQIVSELCRRINAL